MGLSHKIIEALQGPLGAEYIRLDDEDGISGFVVSRRFENMSTLDRQRLIDEALRDAPDPLSTEEQRQILMIAGLTPTEYDAAGARVRVHRIRELEDGSIEVLLHGGHSDAQYVRGAFENQRGVRTTEAAPGPGAIGGLMTFRVKATNADPLTKEWAIRVLGQDQYIRIMQNV